jgi:hypothetical protein
MEFMKKKSNIAFGKLTKNYGKSSFLMGKSLFSMMVNDGD